MAIEEVNFAFPPKWRRRSTSLTLSPSLIMDSFSRKSLSYGKLPHQPLRLTIGKLDGSSFDIEVADGATVGLLKEAVEDFFSDLTRKELDKISWLPSSEANKVRKQNEDWRIDIESDCMMTLCFMSWFSYSKVRTKEFEEAEERQSFHIHNPFQKDNSSDFLAASLLIPSWTLD